MTEPIRLIFCLTTGRSGTAYLAQMMRHVPDTLAYHEPYPDFAMAARGALEHLSGAYDFWTSRKLPAIREQAEQSWAKVYCETSHLFKYFALGLLQAGQKADVIYLHRPASEVALSYWRRGHYPAVTEVGRRYFPHPEDPLTVLPVKTWKNLSLYQLCYWYCLETKVRVTRAMRLYAQAGATVAVISMADLVTEAGFLALLYRLDLPKPNMAAYRACMRNKINATHPNMLSVCPQGDLDELEADVRQRSDFDKVMGDAAKIH